MNILLKNWSCNEGFKKFFGKIPGLVLEDRKRDFRFLAHLDLGFVRGKSPQNIDEIWVAWEYQFGLVEKNSHFLSYFLNKGEQVNIRA